MFGQKRNQLQYDMPKFIITLVLVLCCTLCFAQSQKLTSILKSVEKKYSVSISYDSDLLQHHYLSVDLSNKNLEDLLNELSLATGFVFKKVDDKNVIVTRAEKQQISACITISDESDQQSVSGVTAYVIDHPKVGGISNENGQVRFSGELYPSDIIVIQSIGYENKRITVSQINPSCPTITLTAVSSEVDDISLSIYLTSGIVLNPSDQGIEINTDDLALLPGETAGDILQSIQVLPGVTSGNGKAGALNIRGSSTDQTLIMLDEVPIYHRGHFYGTLSPFNPDAVQSVNVYRSGFHPKYGGRVGGTVDIRLKNEVVDSSEYGAGLNLLYSSGYANIKLDKAKKVGLLLSGRFFHPAELQTLKYDEVNKLATQLTRYSTVSDTSNAKLSGENSVIHDMNSKLIYSPDSTQSFCLSFLNIYNSDLKEYEVSNGSKLADLNELRNTGGSLIWNKQMTQNSNVTISAVNSDYKYRLKYVRRNPPGMIVLDQDHSISVRDVNANIIYSQKVGKNLKNQLDLGYSWIWQRVNQDIYDQFSPVNITESNTFKVGVQQVVFANYNWNFNSKLLLRAGSRIVHFNVDNKVRIEPRANVSYAMNQYLTIKASGGYYSQYLSQVIYFDLNDNRTENHQWSLADDGSNVVNNLQTMFGASFNKKGWLFDLEMYNKTIDHLRVVSGINAGVFEYSLGSAKIYGVDVLIRKRWSQFDLWASYTYALNRWKFGVVSDEEFRPYYEQPHIFNLVGAYNQDKWKFSLGMIVKSGFPDQFVSTGFVLGPPSTPQPDPGVEYRGRYPIIHQLDFSCSYEFVKNSTWRGLVGVSIQNVYNRNNVIESGIVQFDPGSPALLQDRSLIGFAPNVNLNIYW